ncbi:hypothetical protein G6F46_004349 [Rhizopus delemar]|uniref:Uncharacterized protein n=2 Tax=Rhizopus TaxID=4842 RepID=A0A9P7CR12_9FUNG|nr:hypothetical protein G6F55_008734 [Rhizopus delemar]KAG1546945.1 hypothetical protein G6F51_004565 [Rhizopus arrhizus]KAG1500309.1 hypothetical protein G6F54_003807 [Rhizopus delemar]KAG1514958.1 hypothetical protein G6F53_003284 [Rhizopus delemar]KAG1527175.1 hypothetical protein G6F52_001771 [Rhizopus delemar]
MRAEKTCNLRIWLPTSLKNLETVTIDDEKTKSTFDANLLNKFIELDLKNDLSKKQVKETIEEDLTLDFVRNLSTIQEEDGAGHQEVISLFMEEEGVALSPNKETSPLQHSPQITTQATVV